VEKIEFYFYALQGYQNMTSQTENTDKRYGILIENVNENQLRIKVGDDGEWEIKDNPSVMCYKDIDFMDRYLIYADGTIIDTKNNNVRTRIYNEVKCHYYVNLVNKNKPRCQIKIMNLIYETFIGRIPHNYAIAYKDDDVSNITLYNLKLRSKGEAKSQQKEDLTEFVKIERCPDYLINKDGQVYSLIIKNFLTPSEDTGGYLGVRMKDKNGKSHFESIHKLLVEVFMGGRIKGKVIDHKNQNKKDNSLDNLRQVTYSENNTNVNRDRSYIYQYEINDYGNLNFVNRYDNVDDVIKKNPSFDRDDILLALDDEDNDTYGYIWTEEKLTLTIENEEELKDFCPVQTFDGSTYFIRGYKISNTGKLIDKNNTVFYVTPHAGYFRVQLINDKGVPKTMRVHRLVAFAFYPEEYLEVLKLVKKPDVNHIDENKVNNHVNNLEWVTNQENTAHSRGKRVCQIDVVSCKILRIFISYVEVGKGVGIKDCKRPIANACKNKTEIYGFYWKMMEKDDFVDKYMGDTYSRKVNNQDLQSEQPPEVSNSIIDATNELNNQDLQSEQSHEVSDSIIDATNELNDLTLESTQRIDLRDTSTELNNFALQPKLRKSRLVII
jgi:hypothetical protein